MTRYNYINGKKVAFTAKENKQADADLKAWNDDAPNRRMIELRRQRDLLLAETDYMALSDVTINDAWTKYRQALRDITSQTPIDDTLSNIKFPTKPTE